MRKEGQALQRGAIIDRELGWSHDTILPSEQCETLVQPFIYSSPILSQATATKSFERRQAP
jgi:hypothetical protein